MKEIGGYMELEHMQGSELYPDLHHLNLGRTAFVWLLENIPHSRVYIPEYICRSVPDSAESAGFNVVRYRLDEDLQPVWGSEGAPCSSDILYLVSFYGQLTYDEICLWRSRYPNVIVDNAQAFYDKPVSGVHTIYTARKYFGLSDGAYVASDIAASAADLPEDHSGDRIRHLTGRLEENAGAYYKKMLAVSDTFASEIPRQMSAFTQNILRGIDYDHVREKRCSNYITLSRLLTGTDPAAGEQAASGRNPFIKHMPECPFAYPYYHEDGVALRKYLASKKIFVPTNWTYLIDKMPKDSLEYEWSANILPLPVDQRYGEEEMQIIADAVKSF